MVPGNARAGQPDGKRHRNETAQIYSPIIKDDWRKIIAQLEPMLVDQETKPKCESSNPKDKFSWIVTCMQQAQQAETRSLLATALQIASKALDSQEERIARMRAGIEEAKEMLANVDVEPKAPKSGEDQILIKCNRRSAARKEKFITEQKGFVQELESLARNKSLSIGQLHHGIWQQINPIRHFGERLYDTECARITVSGDRLYIVGDVSNMPTLKVTMVSHKRAYVEAHNRTGWCRLRKICTDNLNENPNTKGTIAALCKSKCNR
jgi:hypothetical protein